MVKCYLKMWKLLPASKPAYLHILLTTLFPAVDCGNPGTPSNGRRTGSSTTYNSVVTYTCNTGYTRQGSNRRTCQSNGQWSGSLPRCNRKFRFLLIVFYIVSTYIQSLFPDMYTIHSNSPCENSSPCTADDSSLSLLNTYVHTRLSSMFLI